MNKVEAIPTRSDYINRELSWLKFNQRVLLESCRASTPILDRLKFIAITASNLDEFFKVRVGGLKMLHEVSPGKRDVTGLTADEQLIEIEHEVRQLYEQQYESLLNEIEPALFAQDIRRLTIDDIEADYLSFVKRRFEEELSAVISPFMIESLEVNKAFPLFVGSSLCLCVRIERDRKLELQPTERRIDNAADPTVDDEDHAMTPCRFAILPIPKSIKRFVSIPHPTAYQFITVESIIERFVQHYFPGQVILECVPFRVTRNADMSFDEDGAGDLLLGMTKLLVDRKTSECVRLEIAQTASRDCEQFLVQQLNVSSREVYRCQGPLVLSDFMSIALTPGYDQLRVPDWPALQSPDFPITADIFEIIAEEDRVLLHPFESYDPVVNFVQDAARDPHVIAIKQILYRTSNDSAIVKALADAAEQGKSVCVIVELKARFDEERNIMWAKQLERAGVDVIYGVRGLKTHAKLCIVVRREPQGIRRYLHFATGNYNESTARLYSDISYFTCEEQLGDEAVNIFNAVTGLSVPQPTAKLAFAPVDLRARFEELIEFEIENAAKGKHAKIEAKVNSLSDQKIIDLLYRASQAGVTVNLNVRGICCLRPGVPGLSDRIRVVSIIDRFLEHARIFYFLHDGHHRAFISSADWMGRNLDRRIELLIPIDHKRCRDRILKSLSCYFKDNINAHELQSDGSYMRLQPSPEPAYRSQEQIYEECRDLHAALRHHQTTLFQPHKPEQE